MSVNEAVCEDVPSVAVTVAVCVVVTVLAVAVKVVLVEPAATVTEAGTVSAELVSLTVTVVVDTAAWFNVTVHVLVPPESTVAGLQASEDRTIGGSKVREAVFETPPSVAVTVAVCVVVTVPTVALKLALVAPAATVTDAGTVSAALVSLRATVVAAATA